MSSISPSIPFGDRAGGNPAPTSSSRLVIVVGASPQCAETVARSFADQGEPMQVLWFEHANQALALEHKKTLAGVVVCHEAEAEDGAGEELRTLRHAWPDTPVLPWHLRSAA